jgi:hypothetical protein
MWWVTTDSFIKDGDGDMGWWELNISTLNEDEALRINV